MTITRRDYVALCKALRDCSDALWHEVMAAGDDRPGIIVDHERKAWKARRLLDRLDRLDKA